MVQTTAARRQLDRMEPDDETEGFVPTGDEIVRECVEVVDRIQSLSFCLPKRFFDVFSAPSEACGSGALRTVHILTIE